MPYSATILKLNKEIILIASNKNYSYTRKGKIIKISQPSDKIIIILKFFFVALFMPNCQFCMVLKLLSAHKNRQNNSMINEYGNSFILFYFILFFLYCYLHCDFIVCDNIMSWDEYFACSEFVQHANIAATSS